MKTIYAKVESLLKEIDRLSRTDILDHNTAILLKAIVISYLSGNDTNSLLAQLYLFEKHLTDI